MQAFLPLMKEAAISGLLPLLQHRDYRLNAAGAGLAAFAALLCLLALIFLALGFYLWLKPHYGEPAAFALTGAALLALAGWFLFIGMRLLRRNRLTPLYSAEDLSLMMDAMANDIEKEVSGTVNENPKTALAAAAIAGFLTGKGVFNGSLGRRQS